MKKVLSLLFLAVLCCFVFSGCESLCSIEPIGHSYEAVVVEATCTDKGYTTYTCTRCGDSYTDLFVEALGHTEGDYVLENVIEPDCINGGSYDKVVCCSVCGEELSRKKSTTGALGHSYTETVIEPTDTTYGYTDCVCSCGYRIERDFVPELVHSEGLEMVLDRALGYRVVGMGTCTDTEIIIPSFYNGEPVYAIDKNAFANRDDIKGVKLPKFLYIIEDSAFLNCTSLEYVDIQGTLTDVWSEAFYGCTSLKSVYVSDVLGWYDTNFYSATANPCYHGADLYFDGELVTDLVIPDEISVIKFSTFAGCGSITSLKIHGGVLEIEDSAFGMCKNMESVEIMKGVEHIGEYAFSYCISLTSIKYGGTVEDFGHLQCWRAFFGVATGVVECTDGDVALS